MIQTTQINVVRSFLDDLRDLSYTFKSDLRTFLSSIYNPLSLLNCLLLCQNIYKEIIRFCD